MEKIEIYKSNIRFMSRNWTETTIQPNRKYYESKPNQWKDMVQSMVRSSLFYMDSSTQSNICHICVFSPFPHVNHVVDPLNQLVPVGRPSLDHLCCWFLTCCQHDCKHTHLIRALKLLGHLSPVQTMTEPFNLHVEHWLHPLIVSSADSWS